MKITKIPTGCFLVSEKAEENIEWRLRNDIRRLIGCSKTKLTKGYLPLAKYGLEQEDENKIKRNSVYVDLYNGEIIFLRGRGVVRYDLPKRILDLKPESVKLLGELLSGGQRLWEELPEDAAEELRKAIGSGKPFEDREEALTLLEKVQVRARDLKR